MKRLVNNYSFNAVSKTISFTGFTTLELERILLITNVTKNVILYNFASLGGTVSGNTLTLSNSLSTSGMSNSDKLQIFYDYPDPIGAAGTASTDVSTVQGIAGGIPLNVAVTNGSLEIANDAGSPIPISDGNGSITVDGTFWPATQPVSLATLPALPAGTNTIGAISNTSFNCNQSGTWNISNISGTVSLPTGAATSALQSTGNSSLASIDGKFPSLGTKTSSSSVSVTLAFASTSTLTTVASSTASVTLVAANNNRKTLIILNDSTANLYIALNASAASTTNYSLLLGAKVGDTPSSLVLNGADYSGEIRGIWTTANGFARITEIV